MANPTPVQTKEFVEQQHKRLPDLEKDSTPLGDRVSIRLPVDVQERLTVGGRKNTALMRKIVVEIVRNRPDLLEQYQTELG